MSEFQTAWMVLWKRAAQGPAPFEVAEVAPQVAKELGVKPKQAAHEVMELLKELLRLPEGKQFFRLEGSAVVALEEFQAAEHDEATAQRVYPFEL